MEFLRRETQPKHPVVDEKFFVDPGWKIPPRQSGSCRVSLAFGPISASGPDLCPEVFAAVAAARPMVLDWPDRRPIAAAFLCNSATGWPTNPRGFLFGKRDKNDVTTEEGLQKFRESLLQYADNCIERMKSMDAQGIIVWDIEGQEMPHTTSYIGDPRRLAEVCPEMDRFSDEFMRKFTSAGLRTGVTIRPTEVYRPTEPGQPRWKQREVRDPLAVMDEKIRCAKKRWGCTIFYLDSNVFGDSLLSEEQKKEMKGVPWIMPVAMIEELYRLHPDCLIIPEFTWSTAFYYTVSAPYTSPNLGQLGTDATTRRMWPKAFRAALVNRELVERHWEDYLAGVQGGDVLLYLGWGDMPENEAVRLFYREAALRSRLRAAGGDEASLETLLAESKDPSEEVRLRAATALQKSATPQAAAALVRLLDDQSPIVQRQALRSIAASDAPQAKKPRSVWPTGSAPSRTTPLKTPFGLSRPTRWPRAARRRCQWFWNSWRARRGTRGHMPCAAWGASASATTGLPRRSGRFWTLPTAMLAWASGWLPSTQPVRCGAAKWCRRSCDCSPRRGARQRNSASGRSEHWAASVIREPSSRSSGNSTITTAPRWST